MKPLMLGLVSLLWCQVTFLDDEVYARVGPISDFLQMEPHAGDASTEKTALWILFDDDST